MIQIKTKDNIKAETAEFKKVMAQRIIDAITEAMRKSLRRVGHIAASDFLHGPRPKRLDIKSGRLVRATMGGLSFTSPLQGSSKSRSESIETIKVQGKKIVGEKGLKTFTPFDYPRMWEKTGRKAYTQTRTTKSGREYTIDFSKQKPRPFLEPALNQAERQGELEEFFQGEIDDLRWD